MLLGMYLNFVRIFKVQEYAVLEHSKLPREVLILKRMKAPRVSVKEQRHEAILDRASLATS